MEGKEVGEECREGRKMEGGKKGGIKRGEGGIVTREEEGRVEGKQSARGEG